MTGTGISTFLPLSDSGNAVVGLHITPVVVFLNQQMVRADIDLRYTDSRRRISNASSNPRRANAIVQGRKRLAAVLDRQNEGKKSLVSLRLAAGLSQAQLAEKLGTKQPNIARMERAPGDLHLSTMRQLAQALNVDIAKVIEALDATAGAEAHV